MYLMGVSQDMLCINTLCRHRQVCTVVFHHVLEMEVIDFLFSCENRYVCHLFDIPQEPSSQRFGSVCVSVWSVFKQMCRVKERL